MARGEAADGGNDFRGQRFLLVLSVVLLLVSLVILRPYFAAVAFALLLGYLAHPMFRWLKPRVKRKNLAAGLVVLVVTLLIVLPFALLGYLVVDKALAFVGDGAGVDEYRARAVDALAAFGLPREQASAAVGSAVDQALAALEGIAVPAATAVTKFFFQSIVFVILLFFVISDGDRMVDYVRRVMPLDEERRKRLLARSGERVEAIVYGSVVVSLIQGGVAALGWWILGFPEPVLAGVVMVILSLIPVIGAFVLLLPAAIIALLQGNIVGGVGLLVLNFVLVGLVDDFIRPYVIGKRSSVHPGIILVGIVGGVEALGISGLILGPLLLSLLGPVIEAWAHPENEPLAAEGE